MSQLSRTALLFLLAVVAGCSLTETEPGPLPGEGDPPPVEDDNPPPVDDDDPPPTGDDYFPLEVGSVWTYDWTEGWGHAQAAGRSEGTLTLTVIHVASAPDAVVYTLTEHKEGLYIVGPHGGIQDTSVVDETRTIAVTEADGEVALPEPYMSSGVTVPRYLPASEPDTVAFEGVYFGGCSLTVGGGSSELQLTRGVGMVYHSYWKGGSSQSCSGTLQLQSGE